MMKSMSPGVDGVGADEGVDDPGAEKALRGVHGRIIISEAPPKYPLSFAPGL